MTTSTPSAEVDEALDGRFADRVAPRPQDEPAPEEEDRARQMRQEEFDTEERWVQTPLRVYFARGSVELDEQAEEMLRLGFETLARRSDIVGYRVVSYYGGYDLTSEHQQLTQERAEAVADAVVERYGVCREQLEVTIRVEDFSGSPIGPERGDLLNQYVELMIRVRRPR